MAKLNLQLYVNLNSLKMLNQGCYQQSVVIKNENIIDTSKKIM